MKTSASPDDDENRYEYRISKNGKPSGNGWEKTPNSKNSDSWRRKREEYKERASKPQKPHHPRKPDKPQKPWILGMKNSSNEFILTAADYEYTITDGEKPEGEGWEKTPHPRVENSWRRKIGPSHDQSHEVRKIVKKNHVDAEKLPSALFSGMEFLFGNRPGSDLNDYLVDLFNNDDLKRQVKNMLHDQSINDSTISRLRRFSEAESGKEANARKLLSSAMTKVMGVKPDNYCITEEDMPQLSDEDIDDAKQIIKANQEVMKMMGFVNDDGTVTLYRGTNGQFDEKTGKYKGTNCESWTIDPESAFHEEQILKADIPLERVIGCFAGTGIYRFNEREVTCCTNDLDFKCEKIGNFGNISRSERTEAGNRISGHIKETVKQLLNYQNSGKTLKDMGRMIQNEGAQEAFGKIATYLETPPEILSSLKENPDWLTRLKVAGHPNTNAETLQSMMNDKNSFVKELATEQYEKKTGDKVRNDQPESIEKKDEFGSMFDEEVENPFDFDEEVQNIEKEDEHENNLNAASNPKTSPKTLDLLSDDENEDVRMKVGGNKSTPPETLAKLADDPSVYVKMVVAYNPSTPAESLKKLAQNKLPLIKKMVAANKACSPEILDQLSNDKNSIIQKEVITNPNTSDQTLKKMMNDDQSKLKDLAKAFFDKHQLSVEALEFMADDGDEFAKDLLEIKKKTTI